MSDIANQQKEAGMKMNRAIKSLLSGMFLLCMVSQAQATPVDYGINGAFAGGGTISGTITIDTMSPSPFPMVLVGLNLVTTNGTITGDTYTGVGPINNQFLALVTGSSGNLLFLNYTPSPLVAGGSGPSLVSFVETNAGGGRDVVGVVATPEPGTIFLFGSGLLGLGLWRYRRNLKS